MQLSWAGVLTTVLWAQVRGARHFHQSHKGKATPVDTGEYSSVAGGMEGCRVST